MIGLQINPKIIIATFGVLLLAGLLVGAVVYHEATTASLRADAESAREEAAKAVKRAEKLEVLVRQASAEVEAANRAAEAAKRQAAAVGQIQVRTDKERTQNREVIHEAIISYPQELEAPAIDRAILWRRINQLFGVREAGSAASDSSTSAPGMHESDAPGVRGD